VCRVCAVGWPADRDAALISGCTSTPAASRPGRILLDLRDFGGPADPGEVLAALRDVLARAQAGEHVEIGCRGGHGRSGTALACLALLCDHPPTDAVAWVRTNDCASAVETAEHAAFVAALSP
jgi:hypothetical protein